jgi:hypothetical protein
MAIRLRIRAEPSEKLYSIVALSLDLNSASDAQWGDLEDKLLSWLQGVGNACREVMRLSAGLPAVVRPAAAAASCEELGDLISFEAAIELESIAPRTLRGLLALLDAIGRLDGYVVDFRLGRRPCHMAEAVEAVRSAARTPRTRGRAQSRSQPDEQPDEPREPRWRRSRPAGESAAGSARRGASDPGPGPRQDSSGSDRTGSGPRSRQESSRSDGTGAGPGGWGRGGREGAAAPRAASGSSAAEFFLSKTGLRPPYNVDALKRAFRLGARALHPDVRPGASEAHREFCLFTQGYEELLRGVTG